MKAPERLYSIVRRCFLCLIAVRNFIMRFDVHLMCLFVLHSFAMYKA